MKLWKFFKKCLTDPSAAVHSINFKFRLMINSIRVSVLFPLQHIKPIIRYNRQTLKQVIEWINDDIYKGSVYQYGIPENLKNVINRDIGEEITYSDAMLYLSRHLKKRVNYLELGVSCGKNFFQVMNYLKNSTLTGFEIEEINPTLESFLDNKVRTETWETMQSSLQTLRSSSTEYKYLKRSNSIYYLCADIWDENSWERLEDASLI